MPWPCLPAQPPQGCVPPGPCFSSGHRSLPGADHDSLSPLQPDCHLHLHLRWADNPYVSGTVHTKDSAPGLVMGAGRPLPPRSECGAWSRAQVGRCLRGQSAGPRHGRRSAAASEVRARDLVTGAGRTLPPQSERGAWSQTQVGRCLRGQSAGPGHRRR